MLPNSIQIELNKAKDARTRNKEGMARVCARRAAGLAAKTYLQQHGIQTSNPSAYEYLRVLQNNQDALPLRASQAVECLLIRVDEDFRLPTGVDLLEEATVLAEILLHASRNL